MRTLILSLVISTMFLAPSAIADEKPDLKGFCPVAFIEMGEAMEGDPDLSSTYKGNEYYFASEGAKELFDKNPAKYVQHIAYDGWCATAMAMSIKKQPDPTLYTIKDGNVYLFSSKEAKAQFDKMPSKTIKKADAHWQVLSTTN